MDSYFPHVYLRLSVYNELDSISNLALHVNLYQCMLFQNEILIFYAHIFVRSLYFSIVYQK